MERPFDFYVGGGGGGGGEMFSELDFFSFFHSRRAPVFLFVYNTIRTIEFTMSWIFQNSIVDFFLIFQPPSPITYHISTLQSVKRNYYELQIEQVMMQQLKILISLLNYANDLINLCK